MSLTLTNVASLQAQNALNNTNNSLNTSLQRLSTGLKINSAADGAADYVISTAQQAQIGGLNQAIANTDQAVSVVQTADGALSEVTSLLNQVRGLAVSSANAGANDAASLQANQDQINNALATINSIAQTTQINGTYLLNGSAAITGTADSTNAAGASGITAGTSAAAGTYAFNITTAGTGGSLVGAASNGNSLTESGNVQLTGGGLTGALSVSLDAGDNVNTAATKIQNALNGATSQGGGTGKFSVTVNGGAISINSNVLGSSQITATAVGGTGTEISDVTGLPGGTSTAGTALAGTISFNGGTAVNVTASAGASGLNNQISYGGANGVNFSVNVTNGTTAATGSSSTVTVANNSLVFQTGANANQTASVAIGDIDTTALGTGVSGLSNANTKSLADINVTTEAGAQDAIQVIDQAISQVSNYAAGLGSFQENTLQANASNLQNAVVNATSANSVISNTDFTSEISNFTQLQTQLSATGTVLGNANQTTQLISKLLQG